MNEQRTHILVVEDQGAHAELMRHAFASHTDRFRLTVVGSLQQAQTCLSQEDRPDLVITDLLLPDGKGIELLPKDEHLAFPLVLMTSHGDEKAAADAIKAGALDYVPKSATTLGDMPRVAERALREWSHIVQRMQAEAQRDAALEALQESDLRYHTLFENIPLGIGTATMDGRILMCNDAMLQMTGHPRAELDQFDLRDSYQNPQERALLLERLQTEGLVRDMEVQLKRQDGTLYHASLTMAPVTLGGDDFILTLARDITGQMQAETRRDAALEALRESQNRYQVLFDRMLDGYALHEIICDDDGQAIDYRFLDINPAFETFTGLGRDIIGQRVLKVLPMTERHWIDTYGKVALTGKSIQFENYSQGVGGKWFQVVAFSPAERQFVTIFQEVTRRKQIEEEREALIEELETKNAELERFVYTVSHDLKSPLITITGFLGFLERDAMAGNFERLKDDIARISNAAVKMQQLLDELLELSRIGRMMNPPEQVPMGELAREAVDMIAGQLNERDVQVEISPVLLQPDGPTVYGDRLRLYEVLENLVDNAVKFTSDQPDPRVEIGVRRDGDETVFYVQDNGIGIELPYHDKVFGLFEKLDVGTRGTGVGLAIVKRIVEVHGGRVWVESQGAGQGSTFCFTLADKK